MSATKIFFILVIIVVLVMLPKRATEDVKSALAEIVSRYGVETARNVERIYRKETAHFKSKQFALTNSPGMEVHATAYPYGWTSMRTTWDHSPWIAPIGSIVMTENNTGRKKEFLKFRDPLAAMISLAEYLKKYPPGRWYSTDPTEQARYTSELLAIRPRIVDELTT